MLKQLAKGMFSRVGYAVRPYAAPHSYPAHLRPGTLIDVGANEGQFAIPLKQHLPRLVVHAFEPNPSVARTLVRKARAWSDFHVHAAGLGETEGEKILYATDFSPSASYLRPTAELGAVYPFTKDFGEQVTPVTTLDACLANADLPAPVFLKLDVQGAELEVLRGGTEVLKRVNYIQTEVTFRKFYEQQASPDELLSLLRAKGFEFRGIVESHCMRFTGEPIYCDMLFAAGV